MALPVAVSDAFFGTKSKQQLVPVHLVSLAIAKGTQVAQAMRQRLDPCPFLNHLTVAVLRADERWKYFLIDG